MGCPRVLVDALLEPSRGAHGRPRGGHGYRLPPSRARTDRWAAGRARTLAPPAIERWPARVVAGGLRSVPESSRWRLAAYGGVSVANPPRGFREGALGWMMTPMAPAPGRLGDALRNPATRPRCAAHQGPGHCEPRTTDCIWAVPDCQLPQCSASGPVAYHVHSHRRRARGRPGKDRRERPAATGTPAGRTDRVS
jgi:hypothetical protein